MSPVSLPPQNFVHLPRCYYRYQENENTNIEWILMIKYMTRFVKIGEKLRQLGWTSSTQSARWVP